MYAIWTSKYFLDQLPGARTFWDGGGLSDPRVIHLWDGPDLSGDWLVQQVSAGHGSDWDTYFLFGGEAVWTTTPGQLLSSGSTIVGRRDDLERALRALLTNS